MFILMYSTSKYIRYIWFVINSHNATH